MKSKSVLTFLISMIMVITLFSSCTDNGTTETPAPSTSAQTSEAPAEISGSQVTFPLVDEPVTFTSFCSMQDARTITTYAENMYYQEMGKLTNVYFEFHHPAANGAGEAFNLMMASQEYDDVIRGFYSYYAPGVDDAISQEIIVPLNGFLDRLPNLMSKIGDDKNLLRQMLTDSGNYWMLPCFLTEEQGAWGGPVVRKDLLDKFGMNSPETIADWEVMLTAYRDEAGMPDGPMSLSPSGFSPLLTISSAYGVAASFGSGFGWINKDGVATATPLEPGYKEYLQLMNDWYTKRLIDQDFTTAGFMVSAMPDVLNGKIGVTDSTYDLSTFSRSFNEDQASWEMAAVSLPVKNKGDILHLRQSQEILRPGYSDAISTSVASEDIGTLLSYYDYMYSDEGSLLANWGVENVTFTYDSNGKPQYTELILNNSESMSFLEANDTYLGGRNMPGMYEWTRELNDASLASMKVWNIANNDWVFPGSATMNAEEGQRFSQIMGDVQTYVNESVIGFIVGTKSFEEYDEFLQQIKDMKVEEAVQIKQASLDRYFQRIN